MKRSPLKRSSPMARSTALTRTAMRRKRARTSPEETSARAVVARRSGGRCENCTAAATDWAHRVARSQGGPWCPSNGLHLCRLCHAWSHSYPETARSLGVIVRSGQDPAAIPVLVSSGWVLLSRDGTYLPWHVNDDDAFDVEAADQDNDPLVLVRRSDGRRYEVDVSVTAWPVPKKKAVAS